MGEFRYFISDRGIDGEIINNYLNYPSLRISQIAHKYQKSESEIYRILHAHDISPNRLKVNHQKVQHLSHLGWRIKDIAEFTLGGIKPLHRLRAGVE